MNVSTVVQNPGPLSRALDSYRRFLFRNMVPYIFLAPAVLIYAVFLVAPMVTSFWYSLTDWSGLGEKHFVGVDNYTRVFTDEETQLALKNTLLWTVILTVVPVLAGLVIANALKGPGRMKAASQALVYLPAVIPTVGVALIWNWLYNPQFGFLNSFLVKIGLESYTIAYLGTAHSAIPAVMIAAIWVTIGFPMVLYLAGLQTIPAEHYEAARIDGASRWNVFRHVTVPGLRQTHIVVVALLMIAALQSFAIIYALTRGGPGNSTQVLATWMYLKMFSHNEVGYGSAIGWVLTFMGLAVTIPYVLWMTKDE